MGNQMLTRLGLSALLWIVIPQLFAVTHLTDLPQAQPILRGSSPELFTETQGNSTIGQAQPTCRHCHVIPNARRKHDQLSR